MKSGQLALLFPGQGAQEAGMGRDVAETMPEAMNLWKEAESISNLPLRSIYWESNDDALMADTRNLQPALTVVNLNLWFALSSHCKPACAAGHSLGEYSALCAAQVLSPKEVIRLVSLRGQLMAEADPESRGAMAAVLKLPRQEVDAVVSTVARNTGQVLLVANYNTPGQFVISGEKTAVELALPLIKERKGRGMLLPVSGAFHSPLMQKAAKELEHSLNKLSWKRPVFPVFSNVTGQAAHDGASLKDLSIKQMTSSVRWIDTIAAQYDAGMRTWVEVGPKGALSRMVKPILEEHAPGFEPQVGVANSLEAVTAVTTAFSH